MAQKFIQERIVRFGECDPAGVVYYPVFFNWFHELMEAWFEEKLGMTYADCVQKVGFPAKETGSSFFRPIALGETIILQLHLSHLSKRSFQMEVEILGNGKTKAKGYVLCVCIGVSSDGFHFSPQEIPSELYAKMEKFVYST